MLKSKLLSIFAFVFVFVETLWFVFVFVETLWFVLCMPTCACVSDEWFSDTCGCWGGGACGGGGGGGGGCGGVYRHMSSVIMMMMTVHVYYVYQY